MWTAIFPWSYSSVLSEKVQSTTGKKKVKQIFQTKKDFITCSKLIVNELRSCPTKSDNVYFANNEQASLAFTAACCFAHAEYNLIKFELYNNWSTQAVNNISGECYAKFKQTKQILHL